MQAVVDFILELDKLKAVARKIKPLGLDRYENSADPGIDLNRTIRMLLVHDIGEIDTGDTMAFVEGDWEERKAAELAAVKRIFGLLPDAQASELLALWQEFEVGETNEARFANAVDRAMPVLLNLANDGQSWRENGISYERVVARVRAPIEAGCPALWRHIDAQLQDASQRGWFGI